MDRTPAAAKRAPRTLFAVALLLASGAPRLPSAWAGPIAGSGASGPVSGPSALIPVLHAYFGSPATRQRYAAGSPLTHFTRLHLALRRDQALAGPLLKALSESGVTAESFAAETDESRKQSLIEAAYMKAVDEVTSRADAQIKEARALSETTDLKALGRGLRESDALGFLYLDGEYHEQVIFAQESVRKVTQIRLKGKIADATKGWAPTGRAPAAILPGIRAELTLHEGVTSEKQYWQQVDAALGGVEAAVRQAEKDLKAADLAGARQGLERGEFMAASAERAIAAGKKGLALSRPERSRYYREGWRADHTMRNNAYDAAGRAKYEVLERIPGDRAGLESIRARLAAVKSGLADPARQAAAAHAALLRERAALLGHLRSHATFMEEELEFPGGPASQSLIRDAFLDNLERVRQLAQVDTKIKELKTSYPQLKSRLQRLIDSVKEATGSGGHAQDPRFNLKGVWRLTGFDLDDGVGNVKPWSKGAHGFIVYTDHFMAVAIISTSEPSKMVFYTGPYRVEGDTVVHDVKYNVDPKARQALRRSIEMPDANHLNLVGRYGDGGRAIIRWRR